jgi:hypothetical protein
MTNYYNYGICVCTHGYYCHQPTVWNTRPSYQNSCGLCECKAFSAQYPPNQAIDTFDWTAYAKHKRDELESALTKAKGEGKSRAGEFKSPISQLLFLLALIFERP